MRIAIDRREDGEWQFCAMNRMPRPGSRRPRKDALQGTDRNYCARFENLQESSRGVETRVGGQCQEFFCQRGTLGQGNMQSRLEERTVREQSVPRSHPRNNMGKHGARMTGEIS